MPKHHFDLGTRHIWSRPQVQEGGPEIPTPLWARPDTSPGAVGRGSQDGCIRLGVRNLMHREASIFEEAEHGLKAFLHGVTICAYDR